MNILNFRYCLLILSFMLLEKEFYNHNAFTSFDNLYIINKNNSKYYILNKKNNYAKNLYIFNNHRKLNEEMHNVKENIENDNEDTSTNNFSENDDKYISQNNYKGPKKEEKKEDNEIEQKGTTEVQSELNEVKEVKKEDNKKKESEIDKLINDDILNKKEEEKRNEKEIEVEEKKENKSLELGCPNKFNFLEEVSSDETNNVLSENSLQNYSKFIEGKVQINMENENSNYIKEHGELLQNNEIKTQRIYDENEKKEKGSSHSIWSKCSRSCNGGYTINSDTKEKKNCNEQPCRNCSYKKNINYNEECLKLFQINYDYVKSKLLCKEACLNYNFCSEFSYNYSTGKCILLNTVDELCEIIKEQNNEIYPADYDFHVCSKKLDSHHKKNIILSKCGILMNYNIYIGQLCVKPKIIKREILKDWRDCLNNLNNYENNYIATYDTNNVCSVIDSTFSNWNEIINNEDKFCLFKDSNMIILLKNVSSSKCTSTCLHEKKFSKWSNCIDLGKDSYQIRVKGILSKPYGLDKCLGTLEKKNCFSKEVVTGDFLNDTASCTFNFSLHLDRCSYICSGNNATIPHVFKILHNNVDKYGLSCPINEKIILIEFCKYCEKEKKKRNSSNNSKVSLVDLKRHEDFSINSSEKYKIQNMQKHFPLYIFSSDSKYDLNFNKNNYSFASLDSSTNNSDMVPMNFLISNSVINLTDDDYNKLMKEGSVKVYKDNELIDYKYEDFEIKDENKINEEDKVEDEDKDDSYDDIYNKGTISERLPADDYKVPKIYNKEGEIKNYVIIISVLLSLLLIIFIIYYFDLIQKFKRILSKKRKSNKSMTIAAEKSSGIYIDNAFAETTNV